MLVHIKEVIKYGEDHHFAIPAFNIHGIESCLGVAHAAQNACSPVIIQVSESTIKYVGLKPITHLVSTVAKNIAPFVPIALHLDHGKTFESAIECIRAGFTSVHIDASHLPIEENISLTKQVVEFAHAKGVWVQGEVGEMVGGHGSIGGKIDIPKANLADVIKFANESGVDTVAAAIGTAHGYYETEDVDIELLRQIKAKIKQPFILHGGSGVDENKIREAIKYGVNVINIGTDIKVAFTRTLIENCKNHPEETDPRVLLEPTIKAIEEVAIKNIKLFGGLQAYCDIVKVKEKRSAKKLLKK
jgi:ketose-bisphosphate aldolase